MIVLLDDFEVLERADHQSGPLLLVDDEGAHQVYQTDSVDMNIY